MKEKIDSISLLHHIHHVNGKHVVHHCGGNHVSVNHKLNYNIEHCKCNKHKIDKREVIGHDFEMNEILIEFAEQCPEGGWHIESGTILEEDKNDL
jgi:hypothetical protein